MQHLLSRRHHNGDAVCGQGQAQPVQGSLSCALVVLLVSALAALFFRIACSFFFSLTLFGCSLVSRARACTQWCECWCVGERDGRRPLRCCCWLLGGGGWGGGVCGCLRRSIAHYCCFSPCALFPLSACAPPSPGYWVRVRTAAVRCSCCCGCWALTVRSARRMCNCTAFLLPRPCSDRCTRSFLMNPSFPLQPARCVTLAWAALPRQTAVPCAQQCRRTARPA